MPRDSSGNYTLPLGNPVIDGTIIDTNWANPTMADIAVQLNNVLTRDGLLGPLAPMFFVDGTEALPGIAFAANHATGMYRVAGGGLGFSVSGGKYLELVSSAAVFSVPPQWVGPPTGPNDLVPLSFLSSPTTGYLPLAGGTVTGPFAAVGGVTLGDAAADALTVNSSTVSIPNSINFSGGRVGIGVPNPTQVLQIQATSAIITLQGGAGANQSGAYYVNNGGGGGALLAMGDAAAIAGGPSNTTAMLFTGAVPLAFVVNSAERMRIDTVGNTIPGVDNTQTLGSASKRWSVVFAGTGTINTSDLRDKTGVRGQVAAEKAVALRLKKLLCAFKFKEGARIHFGIVAQDVQDAFYAEGLDPFEYGLFCHDEWGDGDRFGIRYDELFAFILSAL